MNLTVLENRLADFNNTMRGIADNLQHFRELVDKELAEKEAHKDEFEALKKRDRVCNFIAHKGDDFVVCDEFTIPTDEDVDPDKRPTANIIKEGERLSVEKIDCLSSKYDVEVTIFRNDCGISVVLTLDQIRKLIKNDVLVIVGKNA